VRREGHAGALQMIDDAGGPPPTSPCIAAIAWRICAAHPDLP
jgi:hypothetical protein